VPGSRRGGSEPRRRHEGTGHVVLETVRALINPGIHVMIREAAYYHWQNSRLGGHGIALDDGSLLKG